MPGLPPILSASRYTLVNASPQPRAPTENITTRPGPSNVWAPSGPAWKATRVPGSSARSPLGSRSSGGLRPRAAARKVPNELTIKVDPN